MLDTSWDVVVVGSGLSGLRAAIEARRSGARVCVVSRDPPGMGTCTVLSHAWFAGSPWGTAGDLANHRDQTLTAGRGLNRRDLVEVLVAETPPRLRELLDWGLRAKAGDGCLMAEGGGAARGIEIVRCLLLKARELGISLAGGVSVLRLSCVDGVTRLDVLGRDGRPGTLHAAAVVLAAGGAGALYAHHDNPRTIDGAGWVLALDAGAELQDLEFMQFYPLAVAGKRFLLAPQIADLGRLLNERGEDVLTKYDIRARPAGDRERDRLCRALFLETRRAGGRVCLHVRPGARRELTHDPYCSAIWDLLERRFGLGRRPLPVAPVTHFAMGGVRTDSQGNTGVPGLFAAGEVTGGLHGANRLGGNGLSEALVFGARAGESAARWAGRKSPPRRAAVPPREDRRTRTQIDVSALRGELQGVLWRLAGIARSRDGLEDALARVGAIADGAARAEGHEPASEELRLAARAARLLIEAASRREESRGMHWREDHPEADDPRWMGHLLVSRSADGGETWRFEPCGGGKKDT